MEKAIGLKHISYSFNNSTINEEETEIFDSELEKKYIDNQHHFCQSNDLFIDKSKSLKKKRYSFINRNHMFKFDKLSKTKYNITTTKVNSIKKNKSSKKLKSQISEYSLMQNNNRKIFNGKIDDYLITKELGKG